MPAVRRSQYLFDLIGNWRLAAKRSHVLDRRDFEHPEHPDGNFMGPILSEGVTSDITITREEIFGPILCLASADDLDEAIEMENGTRYGNASSIHTERASRHDDTATRLMRAISGSTSESVPRWASSTSADERNRSSVRSTQRARTRSTSIPRRRSKSSAGSTDDPLLSVHDKRTVLISRSRTDDTPCYGWFCVARLRRFAIA